MKIRILTLVALAAGLAAFAQGTPAPKPAQPAKAPAAATKPATVTVAVLETDLGKIVVEFLSDKAPRHAKNFQNLCKTGFYNGTKFHRTVPGFMIQGGDPNTKKDDPSTWGSGGNVGADGKEITVAAEFNDTPHVRGILSMARSNEPDSASSQFFLCVADARFLDGKYSAFGRVIEGMEVVDKIVSAPAGPRSQTDPEGSRPVKPVMIKKAYLEKRPVSSPPAPTAAPVAK